MIHISFFARIVASVTLTLFTVVAHTAPTRFADVTNFLKREKPTYKVLLRHSEGKPVDFDWFPIVSCVEGSLADVMVPFNPQAPGFATFTIPLVLPQKKTIVESIFAVENVRYDSDANVHLYLSHAAYPVGATNAPVTRLGGARLRNVAKISSALAARAYVDEDGNSTLGSPEFDPQYIVETSINPEQDCAADRAQLSGQR